MSDDEREELDSLEDLASIKIAENIGRHKDLLVKKRAPRLRAEVYREALACVEDTGRDQFWSVFPYILPRNKRISFKMLDMSNMFYMVDSSARETVMDEIMQNLVTHVPELQHLEISIYSGEAWKDVLGRQGAFLIGRLKNLTRLDIQIHINVQVLSTICKECTSLTYLRTNHVSIDAELDRLGRDLLDDVPAKFNRQCYVLHRYGAVFFMEARLEEDGLSSDHERFLIDHCLSEIADLELLVEFSNLTRIEVSFSNLELRSQIALRKPLQDLLLKNRESLVELSLGGIELEANVSLNTIFESAGNVEKLTLHASNLSEAEPIRCFGQLKHFFYDKKEGSIRVDQVLSAPLLEYFYLGARRFEFGDSEAFFNRIRNHEILTKLQDCGFFLLEEEEWDKVYAVSELIKTASGEKHIQPVMEGFRSHYR